MQTAERFARVPTFFGDINAEFPLALAGGERGNHWSEHPAWGESPHWMRRSASFPRESGS
jgi:hypothetical protein